MLWLRRTVVVLQKEAQKISGTPSSGWPHLASEGGRWGGNVGHAFFQVWDGSREAQETAALRPESLLGKQGGRNRCVISGPIRRVSKPREDGGSKSGVRQWLSWGRLNSPLCQPSLSTHSVDPIPPVFSRAWHLQCLISSTVPLTTG